MAQAPAAVVAPRKGIADVAQLDDLLSTPSEAALRALESLEGDILILGAGGKMGPTLAMMARRAADLAGSWRRIIGVSRFSEPGVAERLEAAGVQAIRGDLLDPTLVDSLPDAPNVVLMTGMKFGCDGNEPLTWAMNTYLPAVICRRFPGSRIVAFSTGNVYGLTRADGEGSVETDPLHPQGEYAMSCVGRERIFEYFSRAHGVPVALLRLNYSTEMRYGVLVDLAQRVLAEEPIDLAMGYVNVLWQGDANAIALCALADAQSPPLVLNVAGPERLAVRDVCLRFAQRFDKRVSFRGREAHDALLSDASQAWRRYGPPRVGAEQLIDWIAEWMLRGGPTLGKPTHFQVRDGRF